VAQLPQEARNQLVISVPSGNFGDLTAGLLAKSLGLPIKRFIAATNANDTVPRFLQDGNWAPKAPRRRCPTPWTSASRTTGRAWKSCSAVKSGA
jgi:threonine synthase